MKSFRDPHQPFPNLLPLIWRAVLLGINCLVILWRWLHLRVGGVGWGGGGGGEGSYFPPMALALKGELCAISPGRKMSPWACCCRCLLFYLHDIFLFSLITSVLRAGSAGSVSEAGPELYRQVILPLLLTRLELFKCYFRSQPESEMRHVCALFGMFFLKIYLISCHFPPAFKKWFNLFNRFFSFLNLRLQ